MDDFNVFVSIFKFVSISAANLNHCPETQRCGRLMYDLYIIMKCVLKRYFYFIF